MNHPQRPDTPRHGGRRPGAFRPATLCVLGALCASILAGCGATPVGQPAPAGPPSCPPVLPQGNGGATDRCQNLPAHCICQQM